MKLRLARGIVIVVVIVMVAVIALQHGEDIVRDSQSHQPSAVSH
jgi:hypothetical protein